MARISLEQETRQHHLANKRHLQSRAGEPDPVACREEAERMLRYLGKDVNDGDQLARWTKGVEEQVRKGKRPDLAL
jgi:hypothetical protein